MHHACGKKRGEVGEGEKCLRWIIRLYSTLQNAHLLRGDELK